MSTPPLTLFELVERYRKAVNRREQQALEPMVRAYGAAYKRLAALLDSFLLAQQDRVPVGPWTRAQFNRDERYRELMAQIEEELRRFGPLADELVAQLAEDSAKFGLRAGVDTLRVAGVRGAFNILPSAAAETLAGMLQPTTPLSQYLVKQILPDAAQKVTDGLLMGLNLGWNPRKIGNVLRQQFGKGLDSAVRTARTVNLYAYREANRAQWEASGVVGFWQWHAFLGDRTCVSCLNMHGTIHPLTERLNDHWNGRCAALPVTDDTRLEAERMRGTGRKWFEAQPEQAQRQHFGPTGQALFEAWKSGTVKWDDLTVGKSDPAFGVMRQAPSLKEILEKAA